MAKIQKTEDELRRLALKEIRRYRECEGVSSVGIHPIDDVRAGCNWSITVDDLGTAQGDVARRAAIEVQERLSAKFDLVEDSD